MPGEGEGGRGTDKDQGVLKIILGLLRRLAKEEITVRFVALKYLIY